MSAEELLRKKIKRIQLAQEEAERLLEEKSLELYQLNASLETLVNERTQEFEKAKDEAIAANQAKSQFLANMSHEIRTPLNGMLGFIELLKKSKLDESQQEQLSVISKSGELLLTIINDILEFSKIEAGKLDIDKSEFHLKRCVEEIIEVLANQVFEKNLEFPTYLDEQIPKNLMGDQSRIRQVLLNLIGNAVKFTPSGEIAVNVKYSGRDHNDVHFITFEVVDTGVGISKDHLESIFIAFEQADISDTRKYGGTGLGLTISNQIVRAMGGSLRVESQESIGSKFYFTLPFVTPEGQTSMLTNRDFKKQKEVFVVTPNKTTEENLIKRLKSWNLEPKPASRLSEIRWESQGLQRNVVFDSSRLIDKSDSKEIERLKSETANLIVMATPVDKAKLQDESFLLGSHILAKPVKREDLFNALENLPTQNKEKDVRGLDQDEITTSRHLLVVEDNLINQQVALAMLKANGYTADIANNGQEAVDMFNPDQHALILMDCQMPVMDGFDATRKLRAQMHKTPIVAMTANAFKKTKEECFEVGMNDFITKPVKDEELVKVIRRNLLIFAKGRLKA